MSGTSAPGGDAPGNEAPGGDAPGGDAPGGDAPGNLRLIGGEMLGWTDGLAAALTSVGQAAPAPAAESPVALAVAGRPPVRGRALARLAELACPPGGRVLLAGPHDPALIGRLAERAAEVTCLLRSYPDARALAEAYVEADGAEHHGGVRVLCGSVAKLTTDAEFDAVIAADGLGRLGSAESGDLDWADTLELLAAAIRPGGRLLLAAENLLGVHELVRMAPWYAELDGADWTPAGEHDLTRPRSVRHLLDRLHRRELVPAVTYAGFPLPGEPTVLVRADAVDPPEGLIAAACGAAFAGTPVLSDPRRLATGALRAGIGVDLAPVWFVLADRPADRASETPASAAPASETPATAAPAPEAVVAAAGTPPRARAGAADDGAAAVLICDAGEHPAWCVEYDLHGDAAQGWTRRLRPGSEAPRQAGPVRRDPAALSGPLPPGRLLEEVLLGLCLRHDLPALRRLLTGYAGWLAAQPDRSFATPAAVVTAEGAFARLDPSWSLAAELPFDVALARGLRQFAVTLLTSGHPHPWTDNADADRLTMILCGLAEHPVDRPVIERAVAAEAEIVGALRGLDDERQRAFAEQWAQVAATTPPPDVDSHQQLRAALRRAEEQLAAAYAKHEWYEYLLGKREAALSRAEVKLELLSGSLTARVGRIVVTSARSAKRLTQNILKLLAGR